MRAGHAFDTLTFGGFRVGGADASLAVTCSEPRSMSSKSSSLRWRVDLEVCACQSRWSGRAAHRVSGVRETSPCAARRRSEPSMISPRVREAPSLCGCIRTKRRRSAGFGELRTDSCLRASAREPSHLGGDSRNLKHHALQYFRKSICVGWVYPFAQTGVEVELLIRSGAVATHSREAGLVSRSSAIFFRPEPLARWVRVETTL